MRYFIKKQMRFVLLALFAQAAHAADSKATGDNFEAASSTKFDFSEMSIDGKFKAPSGFFLSGRNSQSLSNMVKLRPNFRSELRQSTAQTKVIVK